MSPLHPPAAQNAYSSQPLVLQSGQTPLYAAVFSCDLAVITLLLEHGADKEARSNVRPTRCLLPGVGLTRFSRALSGIWQNGLTPLHWAVANGHLEVTALLLASGADKEARTNVRLTRFARETLLSRYSRCCSQDGLTALHWAASKGFLEIATLLLVGGADKDAKSNVRHRYAPCPRAAELPCCCLAEWRHAAYLRLKRRPSRGRQVASRGRRRQGGHVTSTHPSCARCERNAQPLALLSRRMARRRCTTLQRMAISMWRHTCWRVAQTRRPRTSCVRRRALSAQRCSPPALRACRVARRRCTAQQYMANLVLPGCCWSAAQTRMLGQQRCAHCAPCPEDKADSAALALLNFRMARRRCTAQQLGAELMSSRFYWHAAQTRKPWRQRSAPWPRDPALSALFALRPCRMETRRCTLLHRKVMSILSRSSCGAVQTRMLRVTCACCAALHSLKHPASAEWLSGWQDDWTPLHWAALNGHREVVTLLLKSGTDNKEAKDKVGARACAPPPSLLARAGIRLLSRALSFAVVSQNGWTPLHLAASEGHLAVATLLLERGMDRDAKDNVRGPPCAMQLAVLV